MSIPDRLFRLSKAYLNQVRDQIDNKLSDHESALRELEGDKEPVVPSSNAGDDLMRRAEEKIAATRREAEARRQITPASQTSPVTPADQASGVTPTEKSAYAVLNVPVGSDLSTVQAAYEKLVARCDPRRFPDGSEEEKKAATILEGINAAYETLRKRLNPTDNRFGKLEFE